MQNALFTLPESVEEQTQMLLVIVRILSPRQKRKGLLILPSEHEGRLSVPLIGIIKSA